MFFDDFANRGSVSFIPVLVGLVRRIVFLCGIPHTVGGGVQFTE